mmetsp:Transcript_53859/g.123956  ORF Transcript_53859/g.123956 Transcript_53859/m.123956 type:complete len:303 (+) Transcript_53859:464-1372(+)
MCARVRSRRPSPSTRATRICTSTDSIVNAGDQPELVSSSIQIEPPIVTWPEWKAKRGDTTRTKGGAIGKASVKMISSVTAAASAWAPVASAWVRSSFASGVSAGGVSSALQRYTLASSGMSTQMPSALPLACSEASRLYSRRISRVALALPLPWASRLTAPTARDGAAAAEAPPLALPATSESSKSSSSPSSPPRSMAGRIGSMLARKATSSSRLAALRSARTWSRWPSLLEATWCAGCEELFVPVKMYRMITSVSTGTTYISRAGPTWPWSPYPFLYSGRLITSHSATTCEVAALMPLLAV